MQEFKKENILQILKILKSKL